MSGHLASAGRFLPITGPVYQVNESLRLLLLCSRFVIALSLAFKSLKIVLLYSANFPGLRIKLLAWFLQIYEFLKVLSSDSDTGTVYAELIFETGLKTVF